MRSIHFGWFIFFIGLAVSLGACSSDAGSGGAGGDTGGNTGTRPFPGDDNAALAESVGDHYLAVAVADDEYSEDAQGRQVLRTGIKIVFGASATVGQANALLNEIDAEVIATLADHPAAVVRIPDPGTLQAFEAIVADIQSRGPVKSVLRSHAPVVRALPDNIYETIFQTEPNSGNPSVADEWKYVSQHLPVRGAAAWHVKALAGKPMVVVGDFFGDGDPSTTLYDIEKLPGAADFGVASGGPSDSHGYQMLSIIAARHSSSFGAKDKPIWASGMLPTSARFAAVDHTKTETNAFRVRLLQRLGEIASQSQGTIVVSLSIGKQCTGVSINDPCVSQAELNDEVVDFIDMVHAADLEDRVLFVAAAGNIGGDAPEFGPVDAKSSSVFNAAGSLDGWFDPLTGEEVEPLTNVLVVENAATEIADANANSFVPPFEPTCIFQESFIGGQIAGIGSAFMISGSGETPPTTYDDTKGSSTSTATAQISGLAAYVSAIRPELTPQDLIRILVTTARQPTGLSISNECTDLNSDTPVADAYAAVLATDPPGTLDPSSARARLELLDIASDFVPLDPANPTPEVIRDPDRPLKFDIMDLRRWIDVLTGPATTEIDHGRYDLNGDGIIGGDETAPFDLDISMDPSSSSSIPYSLVGFDFSLTPVTYDESALTDMQIVCYYAMSPLYEILSIDPFSAEGRAEELERVRDLCDPCAAAEVTASRAGTARKQLPEFCEERQEFIEIADLADFPGGEEFLPPAVNEDGVVGFITRARDSSNNTDLAVYAADGSEAAFEDYSRIAGNGDDIAGVLDVSIVPSTRRNNYLLAAAGQLFGFGIAGQSDGGANQSRIVIASDPDGDDTWDLTGLSNAYTASSDINANGEAAMHTTFGKNFGCPTSSDTHSYAIIVDDGTQVDVAECSYTKILGSPIQAMVAMNDSGQVAFRAFLAGEPVFPDDNPLHTSSAIVRSEPDSDALNVIAAEDDNDAADGVENNFPIDINNSGAVVFVMYRGRTVRVYELFVSDGTQRDVVASSDGPFGFIKNAAINDAGKIVFLACLDGACRAFDQALDETELGGLYDGPDPGTDKVIAVGDDLFGSQVTGLAFQRSGLNNAGELTFVANLADGRQLVVKRAASLTASQ